MSEIHANIEKVLIRMRNIFRKAIGVRRRGDWLRANGVCVSDWIYSVTAEDVINKKIPSRVAGEFARAKLFCKIAAEVGLDCYVVCTANTDDLKNNARFINGFPLIAININDELHAFNPAHWPLRFIPGHVAVGECIRSVRHWMPCQICAIVPRDDFMKITSYNEMHKIYLTKQVQK